MAILETVKYIKNFLNLDKFKKLYYYDNGEKIGLDVGAYQEQDFTFTNTITDNPVEFGVNLADTIYRDPIRIKVLVIVGDSEGLVDTVIDTVKNIFQNLTNEEGLIAGLKAQAYDIIDPDATGKTKSGKVYNQLLKIHNNFLPVELVTRDRLYSNFQIESINRKVAVNNYGGAVIEVGLKELITFNVPTTEISQNNGLLSLKDIQESIINKFTV